MKKKYFGSSIPAVLTALALFAFVGGCGDSSENSAGTDSAQDSAETQNGVPADAAQKSASAENASAENAEKSAKSAAGTADAKKTPPPRKFSELAVNGSVPVEGEISDIAALEILPETLIAADDSLALSQTEKAFVVRGKDFVAIFSKASGTLASLVYGKNAIFTPGNGPKLNAFRAVTNNDAYAYRKWFAAGLFDLQHTVVGEPLVRLQSDGTVNLSFVVLTRGKNAGKLVGDPLIQYGNPCNGVPVEIELGDALGEKALTFTTQQIWTIYPDGSVELAANIGSNHFSFDLPRLGYSFGVPAKFSQFTFYGRGPQETYNDRASGAFFGIYSGTVASQITNYTKPQETGNREDVRWCALTDGDGGSGAIFIASDVSFSAQALPVTALDLLFASNPFKLEEKISKSVVTTVHIDAGVRGLGGASCGPDTENENKIFADPQEFGFIIRPVAAGTSLSALANVAPAGTVPIAVVRDLSGNVTVSSKKEGEPILVSVNGAAPEEYSKLIPLKDGGKIFACFKNDPAISAEFSFPKIETPPLKITYVSSEEGGDEAAAMLVDGKTDTIWRSAHSVTQANFPHEIMFDLGAVKKIARIGYLPRQDESTQGDIKEFELYACKELKDENSWGRAVFDGEFSEGKKEKFVVFDTPLEARFIHFRAKSAHDGNIYAAGAEFTVYED